LPESIGIIVVLAWILFLLCVATPAGDGDCSQFLGAFTATPTCY
jgi:hypothetical protein